jgi:hypothetical protein
VTPAVLTVVSIWLGSLFTLASGLKLARYDHASSSLDGYALLPQKAARVVGYTLPWIELAAGMLLLYARTSLAGPALAALLGVAFWVGSADAVRRGSVSPCGCTGSNDDRVSKATVARASVITAGAVGLLVSRPLQVPEAAAAGITVLALVPGMYLIYRRLLGFRSAPHSNRHVHSVARSHLLVSTPDLGSKPH